MRTSVFDRVLTRFSMEELRPSPSQWKEMGWVASGQIAVLVLSVVSIKLMTSIGPEEYGKFILASSIGTVLSLAFFGPLEQGFVRFYFVHGSDAGSKAIFCRSLTFVLGISAIALVFLSVIAVIALRYLLNIAPAFTVIAAMMITISVLSIPLSGMLNAMRLRKQVAMIQVGERIILIALLFLSVRYLPAEATTVMVSITFAYLLSTAVRFRVYLGAYEPIGPGRDTDTPETVRLKRRKIFDDVLAYSMPFLLWGGVSWLQSNGERWVINGFLTHADVGRYGLAANVVNSSAGLGATILGQFVTPIIFKHFSAGDEGSIRRGKSIIRLYSRMTLALFGLAAITLLFAGDPLITLLSSRSFAIGGLLLCVLTLGLGLYHVAQAMTSLGLALGRPRAYMSAKFVAALSAVLLYVAGCQVAGVMGVAGAIVLANMLYLMMVYLANRKLLRPATTIPGP